MMIPGGSGLAMPAPRRQAGAVLVVALLFLLIITMLGVTSMQSTTSEERMSGNTRDWNNALQAAEAALRDAWYDINGICAPGAGGACAAGTPLRNPVISGATYFGNGSATAGTCSSTGLCLPNGTFPHYTLLDISGWPNGAAGPVYPVTFGTYTLSAGSTNIFATVASALASTMASQSQQLVVKQPQYVIEALCMPDSTASLGGVGCPKYYYRITARGYGGARDNSGNASTRVTLQMMVRL